MSVKGGGKLIHRQLMLAALALLFLSSALPGRARIRPEIRRTYEPVQRRGDEKVYRIRASIKNNDTLLISSIFIPYDQSSWRFGLPEGEGAQVSYIDISGSARAGTGVWKERVRQERWLPPDARVWVADCDLGGVEKGGVVHLAFYASVDGSLDMPGKPLRVGCGTCGEELLPAAAAYWSSASEMLLERTANLDTLQVYRYTGDTDTLVMYNLTLLSAAEAPHGWAVAEQDEGRVVFVREGARGAADFKTHCRDSTGASGFVNWAEGPVSSEYGFARGAGSAQYFPVDTLAFVEEHEWGALLTGLSLVVAALAGLAVWLRLSKRRGR